jgi:predicted RNA binding protein YcfA (HicA-like mRNA interferase family)
VKSNELIRLLQKDGWFVIRQSGSHMIMVHSTKKGQIVCPNDGSQEVGKGLEKKSRKTQESKKNKL